METENVVVAGLAIVALLISLFAVGYVYFSQPEEVDLSIVDDNTLLIILLQNDVNVLQDDVDGIPVIDKYDLERLEDYSKWFDNIEDNEDDIADLEDRVDALVSED